MNLHEQREKLLGKLDAIELELANPDATVNGKRLSPREYMKWRHSQIKAWQGVKKELRAVNKTIRDSNKGGLILYGK